MTVKHFQASPNLRHLVASFWTLKSESGDTPGTAYRLVPDCSVDWIFHLGTPWKYHFSKKHSEKMQHTAHIFGQWKNYLDIYLPDEPLFLLGIKFHPWAVRNIWRTDMHELTDKEIALTDLNLPEVKFLEEQIHSEKSISAMIQHLENYLSSWILEKPKQDVPVAIQRISQAPLQQKLPYLDIQPRRLEQRFREEVGISPKLYQRITRINQVIKKMTTATNYSYTNLSYQFGYFDQSHFIRDFKQFTGLPPSHFMRSIRPEGDILNLRIG